MKQTFKRVLALSMVAIMALALASCANTSSQDEPSESQATTQEVETTPIPISNENEPSEEPTPTQEPTPTPSEDITTNEPTTTQEPTTSQEPTPTPTTKPIEHVHSYTSSVTRDATCGEDGIRMYTCSCGESYTEVIKATGTHNFTSSVIKNPTCSEEGTKLYTCSTCGNSYTEVIGRSNDHNWSTRHIDEVGHTESNGTHKVEARRCDCGFRVDIAGTNDTENIAIWNNHKTTCTKSHIYWIKDVPNDPQYIVDIPAHDEVYCTICGTTK